MSSKTTRNTPYRFITWLLSVALIASFISIPAGAQQQEESSEEESLTELQEVGGEESSDADESAGIKFHRRGGDNFKSPRAAERYQRRQEALKQKLAGKQSNGKVFQVAKG